MHESGSQATKPPPAAVAASGRVSTVSTMTNEDGITVLETQISGRMLDVKEREILARTIAEDDPVNGSVGAGE